jgi:23S rRNA U2552 (ribose-2'-O)-methylase RlmE/FtsJ
MGKMITQTRPHDESAFRVLVVRKSRYDDLPVDLSELFAESNSINLGLAPGAWTMAKPFALAPGSVIAQPDIDGCKLILGHHAGPIIDDSRCQRYSDNFF